MVTAEEIKTRTCVQANLEEMSDAYRKLKNIVADSWKILDVGGGDQPTKLATHVIDIQHFREKPRFGKIGADLEATRFTKDTWMQWDICKTPWPYPDKFFDFIWCTQVLEDIRDPIAVCKEMSRVGKAGYINTPAKISELITPANMMLHSDFYNGYWHHRWLISKDGTKLVFEQKNAFATVVKWVDDDLLKILNEHPELIFVSLFWENGVLADEKIELFDSVAFDAIKSYIDGLKAKYLDKNKY